MEPTQDHTWLLSSAAEKFLLLAESEVSQKQILPAFVQSLRKEMGAARTALVLEQTQLRCRAREKFSQASSMFFTPKGYEQATEELIAHYKARKFSAAPCVYDLCCGIGGDALGLSHYFNLELIDLDPLSLLYAEANIERLRPAGNPFTAHAQVANVTEFHPATSLCCWHIDPDRRAQGTKTSQIEFGSPDLETLNGWITRYPQGAIKLSPAAEVPQVWLEQTSLEFIETRGECRQQMAWFGEMANFHNRYAATLLQAGKVFQYSSSERDILPDVGELSNYIYDPAPSLLAAKLLGALAQELNLQSLSFAGVYLTSDVCLQHPFLSAFEVVAVLPLDVAQLRRYCREQNIGTVEIKQRNTGILPEQLRPKLKLTGDNVITLILCTIGDRKQAVVCRRVQWNCAMPVS